MRVAHQATMPSHFAMVGTKELPLIKWVTMGSFFLLAQNDNPAATTKFIPLVNNFLLPI